MTCACCKKPIDNAKFYSVSIGAMAKQPNDRQTMISGDDAIGIFWDLSIHDHDLIGASRTGEHHHDLLQGQPIRNAQAELLFCSKACLKSWFYEKVNSLADLTA
ncbi:hypothetical protein ABMY26_00760 (plasmid) [Azospirillum sp. HJ39]|uniref:hypothetical protein n=1 Tax=Azospirillum sp. HJ39 TaxID=3159496 RepID=UPI0035589308